MSGSGFTSPDVSCALRVDLPLLFFGVIGRRPELLVLRSEVARIWYGSPLMPRFWDVPLIFSHRW